MRKISVGREFLKMFVAGALLFSLLIGSRAYRRGFFVKLVPMPDMLRGQEVWWQVIVVAAASVLLSLIITLLIWLSRSDWETFLASDEPIPPSKAWLISGSIKAAIGAIAMIAGLFTLNTLYLVAGAFLCAFGAWWIYDYSRDLAAYEQQMARRQAAAPIDSGTLKR
jgi:hypothetical protein